MWFFLLFLSTKLWSVIISFQSKLHHCGSSSPIPSESSCSMLLTRALLFSAVSVWKMTQLSADGIENSPTLCLRNYLTKTHQNGMVFFTNFLLKDLKFDRAPWGVQCKGIRKLVIRQSCHCKLSLSRMRSSSSFGAQTGPGLRQFVTVFPCG